MRRLNVNKNQGFTLLEILIALVITGILAALTGPNLLAWLNSNKVQEATDSIQSALRDAQRQAIRQGRICTINFTNGTSNNNRMVYRQITASEPGCLVATNTNAGSLSLPQEVFMVVDNFPDFPPDSGSPGVQFSFRGHVPGLKFTTTTPDGPAILVPVIIVLYPAANASAAPYPNQEKKCLVIASLLGIVKQGTYKGASLTNLDASKCQIRLDGTQPPSP
jgi:prepilin-type N-terminal cleavage/methylation domain-containing protein